MKEITRMQAIQAAEFYNVSEENRDAWISGYCAGLERGKKSTLLTVAQSCLELSEEYEIPQNNAKAEE